MLEAEGGRADIRGRAEMPFLEATGPPEPDQVDLPLWVQAVWKPVDLVE